MANENKTRLSKSILEMKFMKRTKDKVEQQIYQEEGEEYFGSHLTPYMKQQTGQFIIEPSYVFCEKLIEGRLSFQGMNPEIERLMELEELAKQRKLGKQENDDEAEISDSEMANRWSKNKKAKTEGPHTKSFNKKWERQPGVEPLPKKPKFLKPED